MDVDRSQIEQASVEKLRENYETDVLIAASTGIIPATFQGDPTFYAAVCKRRKSTEDATRSASSD